LTDRFSKINNAKVEKKTSPNTECSLNQNITHFLLSYFASENSDGLLLKN